MQKRKKIVVNASYIDFIKDRLPYQEQEPWWKAVAINKETKWDIPTKIELGSQKSSEEYFQESSAAKKVKKLKLKYTQEEVKRSIQEDEKSLKDVEKLEEHLEEDIQKAEEKLKK